MKSRLILIIAELLTASCCINAQGLPTDGKLTIRPMLQQLGEEQGKTGSIVAINPANGENCVKNQILFEFFRNYHYLCAEKCGL